MARSSSKIKCLTTKDKEIRTMGQKTGWFTAKQAKELNGISQARLDKLTNSSILEKCSYKDGIAYKVVDKTDCKNGFYHRSSTPSHDLKLTDKYLQLTEHEREHLYTADAYFREHNIEITQGAPDLVIATTEEIVFLESITENYTTEQIEQKETVATECGATLEKI